MLGSLLLFCSSAGALPFDQLDVRSLPETHAVSLEVLARSTGKAGFVLTEGNLQRLGEAFSRSSFVVSGELSQVEMDTWWGTTGAEMIAQSVRAQQ